jgi:hypothetical protein
VWTLGFLPSNGWTIVMTFKIKSVAAVLALLFLFLIEVKEGKIIYHRPLYYITHCLSFDIGVNVVAGSNSYNAPHPLGRQAMYPTLDTAFTHLSQRYPLDDIPQSGQACSCHHAAGPSWKLRRFCWCWL